MSRDPNQIIEDARMLAMEAVLEPTVEYFLRRICRWYARSLNTSLPVVESLPLEDVLQAYYETRYEDMDPEDRDAEIQQLALDPRDRDKALQQQEVEDQEFLRMAQQEAELQPPDDRGFEFPTPGPSVPIHPSIIPEPQAVKVSFVDEVPEEEWGLLEPARKP